MSETAPPPVAEAPLVEAMLHLLDREQGKQVSLGHFVAAMGQRGFGFCLIVFGILAAISPPGVGSVMGAPSLLFAAQMVWGFKQPWVPGFLARREFSADGVKRALERARPWLRRIEIFAKPRVSWLARGLMERIIGIVVMILCCVILLPGPLTNNPPGIAIMVLGFALAERDGILAMLGLVAAVVAFLIGLSAFIAVAVAIWAWAEGYF